jgi:hypothetical protein
LSSPHLSALGRQAFDAILPRHTREMPSYASHSPNIAFPFMRTSGVGAATHAKSKLDNSNIYITIWVSDANGCGVRSRRRLQSI